MPHLRPHLHLAATALFASLFAGLLAGATPPARAADLYYDDPSVRTGSAYDDPRYADMYGRAPPTPRARIYTDRDDERDDARRFAGRCPSKDEISRRLESNGWGGFINPQVIDRDTASIDARRPNGRPFRLEVDRCSGNVLAATPLERPRYSADRDRYGAYADGDRWRDRRH